MDRWSALQNQGVRNLPRVLLTTMASTKLLDTAARTECPTASEKKSYSGMPGYLPRPRWQGKKGQRRKTSPMHLKRMKEWIKMRNQIPEKAKRREIMMLT